MTLFEFLKVSWDIKNAIENIVIIFLRCIEISIPAFFAILFIKLCLIIFW